MKYYFLQIALLQKENKKLILGPIESDDILQVNDELLLICFG